MSTYALIFAGGVGRRMNSNSIPKQFLKLHGKPIIIFTLEKFSKHPLIDGIVVSCVEPWISELNRQISYWGVKKVLSVVPGGKTGQDSIYNGLIEIEKIKDDRDCFVLIHDGVRPLIDEDTISRNIKSLKEFGASVTVAPAIETIITKDGHGYKIVDRSNSYIARAPQGFRLSEILDAHRKSISEGKRDFVDSCSMMSYYGYDFHIVQGPIENIKITTPMDFFLFRAIIEAQENSQIFGF